MREHLIEQIGVDLRRPGADRMIALHLLDQLDEAGYLRDDLDASPAGSAARSRAGRGGARARCSSSIRPACSPAISRNAWPCSCATATGSIRRCRRCSTTCRLLAARNVAGADAAMRRRRRGPAPRWSPRSERSIRGPAWPSTRRRSQPVVPDILMLPQPERRLAGRAEPRDPAAGAGQQPLLRRGSAQRRPRQGRARVSDRAAPGGQLAGQDAATSGPPTILKVATRDRAPAGRLLPPRRAARCGPLILRDIADAIGCTKARSAASPPTNTSRRRAASSSSNISSSNRAPGRRRRCQSFGGGGALSSMTALIDGEDPDDVLSDERDRRAAAAARASRSPAARSPNTARRCASPPRCSAAGRRH